MKCQKCGAQMVSGHLYCDICGAEYQIVPDFEPEIELSIAESLSTISESIENHSNTSTEEIPNIENMDAEQTKFKVPAFSTVFLLVLLCFIFLYTGYYKYSHSVEYRTSKALEAFSNYDYYNAAQIYKSLRKEYPQDAYWYIKEAESKLMLNKAAEAYHLALQAIDAEENSDLAYEFLLSYLEGQDNYIEMNQLLKDCTYPEIKEKYWEYLWEAPKLNYESGSYNTSLELFFEKEYKGNIYYTLDKTIPDADSMKYEMPIQLGNGTHILTIIYETPFGIFSEPIVYEYQINSDIPLAPVITVDSGTYAYAEMIEVNLEPGTTVYYTTDLTQPTEKSTEYTGPIPMPLGESQFNFIAYSSKGIAGKVTTKKYNLEIKYNISVEDASIFLMQNLITAGHILNFDGSIQDRYGVFHYFYKYTVSEAGKNYYVYEEHYLENQINNPLNQFYAVDVLTGSSYKLIFDYQGNFTRVEF